MRRKATKSQKTKRNRNGTVGKINRQFKLDNIIFEMVLRSPEKTFTRLYRLFYEMLDDLEAIYNYTTETCRSFIHSSNRIECVCLEIMKKVTLPYQFTKMYQK